MCNEIKCAIQYTVDLINNNINRDVQRIVQTARRMCKQQEECANMVVPGMYTLN